MVEQYHEPLQQIYFIITIKILSIQPNLLFQISFMAINDFICPNVLVTTLLVFSIYPRIIELDTLDSSITQYTMAMKKTINKVCKYTS